MPTFKPVFENRQTTTVLLETMAGKGTEVGRSFEELRAILDRVELKEKMGVCLDTCHVWDGGYDIVNHLDEVLEEFDAVIGLNYLKAIHSNDSLNPLGAHKDRHARLGEGHIGLRLSAGSPHIRSFRGCPLSWRHRRMTTQAGQRCHDESFCRCHDLKICRRKELTQMEKEIKEDKMLEFRYVIKDETGLHVRPAGMLAKLVRDADCAVTITKGDKSIDAGKLIAVMGLGIHQGDEITVSADDEEVLARLKVFETYL